jgi:hypothetical protein
MKKSDNQPHGQMSHVNRRRFLRGLGACIALPAFGSLEPLRALAAPSAAAVKAPVRMAFLYVPNGIIPATW